MDKSDKMIYIGKNMYELMPLFMSKIKMENMREELGKKGFDTHLNKSHIRTLFLVGKKKNLISSDLGKLIGLERGSVTTLVKYLISQEYLEKIQCEKDRRKQFLVLTDKGKKTVKELNILYVKEISNAFAKLDNKDIDKFIKSLDTLVDIIHRL
jgi:DNA-binding MarR family transcriptional regulator